MYNSKVAHEKRDFSSLSYQLGCLQAQWLIDVIGGFFQSCMLSCGGTAACDTYSSQHDIELYLCTQLTSFLLLLLLLLFPCRVVSIFSICVSEHTPITTTANSDLVSVIRRVLDNHHPRRPRLSLCLLSPASPAVWPLLSLHQPPPQRLQHQDIGQEQQEHTHTFRYTSSSKHRAHIFQFKIFYRNLLELFLIPGESSCQ